MLITGDHLLKVLLAVIGALLIFLLNDFNERLRVVEYNVQFVRGQLEGPLIPMR